MNNELKNKVQQEALKIIGIYKIINPKNKIYIGQTIDYKKRLRQYKNYNCLNQTKLYNSLCKYKYELHIFELIEECLESELNNRERYWQELYDVTSKKGLNCKLVNSDDKSGKVSDETKLKISNSMKGKICSIETKDKMSKAQLGEKHPMFGKKHSDETKEKQRKALLGNKNHNYNKKFSEETKLKMSKFSAIKKQVINIETNEIYKSAKEVSNVFNINYSTLVWRLSSKYKGYKKFIYYE